MGLVVVSFLHENQVRVKTHVNKFA